MVRRTVWIGFVAGALVLALGASAAYGSIGDIFSTAHDVGSPGNPTCMQCHTPHKADGSYLWAMTPSTSLPGLGGLCFSCHDGAIAGSWIPDYSSHPTNPGIEGQDCDRCHDPHEDNWKFATDFLNPDFRNANLCRNCHWPGDISHDIDVLTDLPVDRTWDPNSDDFIGTRLFNEAGSDTVASGDGYIKCATCHSPHGGTGDGINTMPYSESDSSHSPICENCHQ
jgi:predicted CXXCH cytochrome family protein